MQNNPIEISKEQQRKGRMVFMLMLIFFIVPIVVVIMMYQLNWKPSGESAGELIKPPRLINVPHIEGKKLAVNIFKDKWSVVYIAKECSDICLAKLKDMRQLHVSLYKDIDRVQRVLITSSQALEQIKQAYPELVIINQSKEQTSMLERQFAIDAEDPVKSNRLYLVDPLGFLMMSYTMRTPLKDVRKDLTRLLRFSWTG